MNEMKNEMKDGQTYGDVLTERFQFYQTLDKKRNKKLCTSVTPIKFVLRNNFQNLM
jgi:hypothetical protein